MEKLIITDTDINFNASDFEIPGAMIGFEDGGYVRKRTLRGGRQEGVELLEVSNGKLSIRICPTRGMGIIDGTCAGKRIGWTSPVEEVIHPGYIHLLEMGGRGCHYGFNELINRCGLCWMGAMGDDETVDNMGNIGSVFLPLHGKIGWTPARKVKVEWEDGTVYITGEIAEQLVFGQNLVLRSVLSMNRDRSSFIIEDTLINKGSSVTEYEMLYHVNIGQPILEGGARLYSSFDAIMPRDKFAEEEIINPFTYPAPDSSYIEKVFFLQGYPDPEGYAHSFIVNKNENLGVSVGYKTASLPYSVLWKYCNAQADGYVTGLNPCSDFPNTRKSEREAGRVKRIGPGEEIQFNLKVDFVSGESAVMEKKEYIEASPGKKEIIPEYNPDVFSSLMFPGAWKKKI